MKSPQDNLPAVREGEQPVGSVKLSVLINTGRTHDLLSNANVDRLPAIIKEGIVLWLAMLADGSGLTIWQDHPQRSN